MWPTYLCLLLALGHLPRMPPAQAAKEDIPRPLPDGTLYSVVTKHTPPFVMVDRSPDNGSVNFRGWSIRFLENLAAELNFNYTLTALPDGTHPENLIDAVADTDSEYNMSIAAITISSLRSDKVQFTTPYYDLGLRIVHSPREKGTTLWQFLVPFAADVWVLNALIFCVLVILFAAFERKHIHTRVQYPHRDAILARLGLSIYFICGSVIQSFRGAPATPEGKILSAIALAFFFIMASTYTANLASFVTRTEYTGRIYDVNRTGEITQRDLVEFVDIIAIRNESAIETWFNREVVEKGGSKKNYLRCSDYSECNSLVLNDSAGGTIYDEPLARHELATHSEYADLRIIGKKLNLQGYGIALQKGHSNFTELLSREILRRRSNGLLETLDSEFFHERMDLSRNDDGLRAIRVREVGGIYMIVALSLLLCLTWFAVRRWRKQHRPFVEPETTTDPTTGSVGLPLDTLGSRIKKQEILLGNLLQDGICPDNETTRRLVLRGVLETNLSVDRMLLYTSLSPFSVEELTSDSSSSQFHSRSADSLLES